MTDNERWDANRQEHDKMSDRLTTLEKRLAEHDTQYAVINTKLSAILWGLGVVGTAVIGVLVKLIFKV